MFGIAKKLLSKSKTLNATLGEVVREFGTIESVASNGFVAVRLKKELDGGGFVTGLKLKSDWSAGIEGRENHYLYFDMDSTLRLREALDQCIEQSRDLNSKHTT